MDPIPQMVIQTALAKRKGEITVSTVDEIDELISSLIVAKTGLQGAASAIGAQGAMDAARQVEAERAGQLEADPAAIPTADGEHVTCPACGFRDGRHNPAGCRRQESLARIGEQVARLSHAADVEPPASEPELERTGAGVALARCGRHLAMDKAGRCDHCEEAAPLAKVHPLRPDSEVTIVGSVDHHPTFTCCQTPMPWPAAGLDVTCPDCYSVWEREPVAVGVGARLKVRGAAS